ncbi:ATP-binding protein [Streptomyces sp. NPDC058045]|uniref:ATP-binding protein n=1 Tax=Streptomyces sp. NPDC058045 TaxID=3346311 RepID=UPI0036E43EFA
MFASDPGSVSKARAYAREVVEHYAPDAPRTLIEDLQLIVSELVTNSIRYGTEPGDSVAVVLSASAGRVRVEVHDPSRRYPRFKAPSADRQRGRGLIVLDALAHKWGVAPRPFGKFVWAELAWH